MADRNSNNSSSRSRSQGSRSRSESSSRKRDDGLAARTGRTMRDRPYASAAIAAGAASIVAGIAGLLAMKRSSGKNWSEFGDDLSTRATDTFSNVTARATDTLSDVTARAKEATSGLGEKLRRDGVDSEKTQAEIMQEALTLKQTGEQSTGPRGPIEQQDIKAGIATSNHEAKAGARAYD